MSKQRHVAHDHVGDPELLETRDDLPQGL